MTSLFDLEWYERDGVPLKEKVKAVRKKLKEWGEEQYVIDMICNDADGVETIYNMKKKPFSSGYALYAYAVDY